MDEEHHRALEFSPVIIGLMGIIAGAIMVAIYHCITVGCHYHRGVPNAGGIRSTNQSPPGNQRDRPLSNRGSTNYSMMTLRTTIFRYSKDCNQGMCAVCLCDFSEGEEIRVLPECLHLFHVACIDKWLNSHPNCPLCRAGTSSLPQHMAVAMQDSGTGTL